MIPAPFHKMLLEEIEQAKQLYFAALVVASEEIIKGAPQRISCRRAWSEPSSLVK